MNLEIIPINILHKTRSKDTAMHKNEAKIVQNNLKALLRNLHTNLKMKPSMKKEMYARMFNRLQQMKKNH